MDGSNDHQHLQSTCSIAMFEMQVTSDGPRILEFKNHSRSYRHPVYGKRRRAGQQRMRETSLRLNPFAL